MDEIPGAAQRLFTSQQAQHVWEGAREGGTRQHENRLQLMEFLVTLNISFLWGEFKSYNV